MSISRRPRSEGPADAATGKFPIGRPGIYFGLALPTPGRVDAPAGLTDHFGRVIRDGMEVNDGRDHIPRRRPPGRREAGLRWRQHPVPAVDRTQLEKAGLSSGACRLEILQFPVRAGRLAADATA